MVTKKKSRLILIFYHTEEVQCFVLCFPLFLSLCCSENVAIYLFVAVVNEYKLRFISRLLHNCSLILFSIRQTKESELYAFLVITVCIFFSIFLNVEIVIHK